MCMSTVLQKVLELSGLDSCELPHGYWESNPWPLEEPMCYSPNHLSSPPPFFLSFLYMDVLSTCIYVYYAYAWYL